MRPVSVWACIDCVHSSFYMLNGVRYSRVFKFPRPSSGLGGMQASVLLGAPCVPCPCTHRILIAS